MRGRCCPKAWVFPVPERVCSKVLSTSSKSLASRVGTRKNWHASKNLPAFRWESLRSRDSAPGAKNAFAALKRPCQDELAEGLELSPALLMVQFPGFLV